MDMLKFCGIAIICAVSAIILRAYKSDYSIFLNILGTTIFFSAALAIFYPVISYISEIAENTAFEEYIFILEKALGICMLTEIATDICDEAKLNSLSQKVNFVAKALIIYSCMPLIRGLLDFASSILEK